MTEAESLLREAFGLTSYETRVYVALLARKLTAKDSARAASVPLPRVYDTLRGLVSKGFVKLQADGYSAVEPSLALATRMRRFKATFEEEQTARDRARARVERELKHLYRMEAETGTDPVLLSGLDSIGEAFIEAVSRAHDAVFLVRKAMKVKGTFIGLLQELTTAGKRIRVMIPSGTRLSDSDRSFAKSRSIAFRETDPPILDMMVAGERDVMIGVPTVGAEEPFSAMAIWIRNRDFAKSARASLEEAWRLGRPT